MKAVHYSIPFGMKYKKYYCSDCETRLNKEKIHRIVTKNDRDYYRYHDKGSYPRFDHDVYEYQFVCPTCNKRITYYEQCIIKRIQKIEKVKKLTQNQINQNYEIAKIKEKRKHLINMFLITTLFLIGFCLLYYFVAGEHSKDRFFSMIIFFCMSFALILISGLRKFFGKDNKNRAYSFEEEEKLKKLHTYSSNNKLLIDKANKCYCFYCKEIFDARDVNYYLENENTALCPKCMVDSVLPDNIDEALNEEIIEEMNKYWF